MWSLRRLAEGKGCRPTAKGRIEGEQLVELEKLVASESGIKKVVLDLGTQLRNCPAYIREWIAREQGGNGTTR
jgi:hypothetical protein